MKLCSRSQDKKFWLTPPPRGSSVHVILRERTLERELLRGNQGGGLCDRLICAISD